MASNPAKLAGINAEFGTAPDEKTGLHVPIVTLHLQCTVEGEPFTLPPLWMTAEHALLLADHLTVAAHKAGKPAGGQATH